jgi:hypothetical protein
VQFLLAFNTYAPSLPLASPMRFEWQGKEKQMAHTLFIIAFWSLAGFAFYRAIVRTCGWEG